MFVDHGKPSRPVELIVAMSLGSKNLSDLLEEYRKQEKTGIPVEVLLEYMEDAAKGMDYLNAPIHDLGKGPLSIIHGDIKPQNLLIVGNSLQICDFGLARGIDEFRKTATAMGILRLRRAGTARRTSARPQRPVLPGGELHRTPHRRSAALRPDEHPQNRRNAPRRQARSFGPGPARGGSHPQGDESRSVAALAFLPRHGPRTSRRRGDGFRQRLGTHAARAELRIGHADRRRCDDQAGE